MKKRLYSYICEFFGTSVLVLFGCGTAIFIGCNSSLGSGHLLTALSFGLTLTVLAFLIGDISGCHVNPAVSLAMLIHKKLDLLDFIGYFVSQMLGGILGGAILFFIVRYGGVLDLSGDYLEGISALGANGISGVSDNIYLAILVEVILTSLFVLTVLKASENTCGKLPSYIIIGLSLVLVHILGISLTGTSVNPARSFGPALFAGGDFLKNVWAFFVGPFMGSLLASLLYFPLSSKEEK